MITCNKNNKTCFFFILIGVALAFFSLTPEGINLEEEFGLPILFELRGEISPPKDVIIVSIDELSAQVLRLPDNPEKWPRSYYAELINKINQQSPAIIAFNMTFEENRDIKNDQLLTQAIANSNNIILSNYLKRQTIQSTGSFNAFQFERIINPIPLIDNVVLATAPFLLPKTATTVKQFWAYKNSAGDVATFPTTIFQHYLIKQADTEINNLLRQFKQEYQRSFPTEPPLQLNNEIDLQKIKSLLINNPENIKKIQKSLLSKDFSFHKKKLLSTWLSLLEQPNSLYFNYYGGAESIPTIPFYQALVSDILNPNLFKNKIVLVGYSKTIEPEKSSGLYTTFSDLNNDTTSPIEIAATAVANLLENTWLKPLQADQQFILIICWTLLLSTISRFLSYKQSIALLVFVTLTYLFTAYTQFVHHTIWLPLFIPLIIQVPLILIFISTTYFLRGKQERQNMQHAFSLYVPDHVVTSISQQAHDSKAINQYGELIQGICMATDAGQYTTLSESMAAEKLHQLINQYYGVIFPVVKQNKGIISDVVGDAMFAIWNGTNQEQQTRTNACLAALEIKKSIDTFNQSQPHQLPTRLGLNFGSFRLGNVGSDEHYEYRAVGDTVNTATRIEGLNKLLGTQILVGSDVILDLVQFSSREVGFFLLKGKSQAVNLYELMDTKKSQSPQQLNLIIEFSIALKLFQQQYWLEALNKWIAISQLYPSDGPTLFYIQYLKKNLDSMPPRIDNNSQETIITIGNITTPLLLR